MSGNFAIKGGGGGRLMANAILNFHFDFPHPSLNMRLVGTMTGASFNCAIKPQILQIKWIKQVKIHQSEKKV